MSNFDIHREKFEMYKRDAENEANSIPTKIQEIRLKMHDVFYNNGITNIFWATKKAYDVEYKEVEEEIALQIETEELKLALTPFALEIIGKEENIKEWYRKVGNFLTDIGLSRINRLVYNCEKKKLENGYSYGVKTFASRTWGTSIGSKFISAPSLQKKLSVEEKAKIRKALQIYQTSSGKNLKALAKDKLFKEKWEKEGVYILIPKNNVINRLLGERDRFNQGKILCEICSSSYTNYGKKKSYKRDTSIVPTVIGLDYSGFKDLSIGKNLVCAFCDLVLRYNFFWTFYARLRKKTLVLHIDIPDLIALFQLKEGIFDITMEDIIGEDIKQSTNIPYQGFYLSSPERFLLALALFVYKRIKEKVADENLKFLLEKKKDFIQIFALSFDATTIYQMAQYHKLSRFLDFLNRVSDTKFLGKSLSAKAFILKKGQQEDIYEKSFLSNLLEFRPIAHNLSQIAFLKIKGDIYSSYLSKDFEGMVSIFYQFLAKEETMEKESIELIQKYGWSLGTIAKNIKKPKGDPSVFYELRDIKSLEQFIKVLRDFSFRMIKKAEELKGQFDIAALNTFTSKGQEFVNLLNTKEDRWEEIRDLLAFFAVNTFLKGISSGNSPKS